MKSRIRMGAVALLCACCFPISGAARVPDGASNRVTQVSQDVQRKLSVIVDKASIYLEPSAASPIIGYVMRDTPLKSYAGDGEWYRIMLPAGQEMISAIGYISAKDVKVLEEQTLGAPDFWSVGGIKYKGLGLEVTFGGGFTRFGGGDIADASRGMYDEWAALIAAQGYSILDREYRPFHSGVDASVDIAFRLSPRLAVGISGEYLHARDFNKFGLMKDVYYYSAYSTPILQAVVLRPAIFWTIPLGGLLSLRLDAGPAVFLTNFEYNRNYVTDSSDDSFHLKAHDVAFGVQAGAALEVNLNERISLLLRTAARYARVSSLEGDEKYERVLNREDASGPQYTGALLFGHRDSYPVMTANAGAAPADARSAVFDFTGFSLSLGLKIRI
jgi:hypothetical protein